MDNQVTLVPFHHLLSLHQLDVLRGVVSRLILSQRVFKKGGRL